MVKGGHKVQNSTYKINKSWDVKNKRHCYLTVFPKLKPIFLDN